MRAGGFGGFPGTERPGAFGSGKKSCQTWMPVEKENETKM